MSALRRDPRLALIALSSSLTAIALSLTGEVSPIGLVVPLVAAHAVFRPRVTPRGRAFEWSFQIAALGFLAWFVTSFMTGRLLGGAAVLTFFAQVYALLQPCGLLWMRRLQMLGFFQLVVLAASTTAIFFGPLLLAHLVLAPALYVLAELEGAEGEPRRPAALPGGLVRAGLAAAAAVLVVGAVTFLVLPRYEAGLMSQLHRPGQRMSGFSESVTLGEISSIQGSDKVVMRVTLRGKAPEDLRWRGIALDRFTGRAWANTAPPGRPTLRGEVYQLREPTPGSQRVVQEISIEPSSVRALFHLPGATRLVADSFRGVRMDRWGNLQRSGEPTRRTRYEVTSELQAAPGELDDGMRAAFLQLPELDPRVAAAAREAAGEGDDAARAARILSYLRSTCSYALDVNDLGVPDPVSWFLFEQRRGHCEYFATSMAVMLRTVGIPSRVVNGFQSGDYSRIFDAWVVRQRNAHSWVEAWIPGLGWTMFDPTPPEALLPPSTDDVTEIWRQIEILWDDNVIGFNYTAQLGFLTTVREWWDGASGWARRSSSLLQRGALALAALGAGWIALALLRRRRGGSIGWRRVPFYARALKLLARRGHRRRPSQTPLELAREVAERDSARGEAALELTRLYYDARYGGKPADPGRVSELLARL